MHVCRASVQSALYEISCGNLALQKGVKSISVHSTPGTIHTFLLHR